MTRDLFLKGGFFIGCRGCGPVSSDILVRGGRIAAILPPESVAPEDSLTINVSGYLLTAGLVDAHVHFREPGFSYKETIASGSRAASRGGYTAVFPMPNLEPAPDSPETIAVEKEIIRKDAVIKVLPYATITKGRKGLEPVDFEALRPLSIAFSDDGSGIQSDAVMERAMKGIAAAGGILAAHCEDCSKGDLPESEWGQIARDLEICARTGCSYHVCHISTAESVRLIREAKMKGVRVSCETAPHYLTLCCDDVLDDGRFRMNPPLRTPYDRDALVEGLADGTIDIIATDHAPHSREEKSKGFAASANGIVGLETAFPVLYTCLVKTGKLSLERLLEAMAVAPRRIFGLEGSGFLRPGDPADIAVFDLMDDYVIDSSEFLSKGHSTPFEGWKVKGRTVMTIVDGVVVWKNE